MRATIEGLDELNVLARVAAALEELTLSEPGQALAILVDLKGDLAAFMGEAQEADRVSGGGGTGLTLAEPDEDLRSGAQRLGAARKLGAGGDPPAKRGGAVLLDELAGFLRGYVVMSDAQRDALALWAAHTHAFEAAEATPYLHVTSAEKECGKSRLLDALELVVARPLKSGGTTAAALARAVAQDPPPTMLLDEADNTFKRDREYVAALMGILNDGYRRGGRTLLCLPPKWEPSFLPVFAPKALAGIGDLPDTVASRSIRIELKRRAPGEHVERFRYRQVEADAAPLRGRLTAWCEQHLETLANARPEVPDELGDRAADVWEPLLAIADSAGDRWPERARTVAVELSAGKRAENDSIGVRLLADIQCVFDEKAADRLATSQLLDALCANDEAPWGDWYGKPLSGRALAKLIRPYGIRPNQTVWLGQGKSAKGLKREQFEDAFSRYLPLNQSDESGHA